MSDIDKDLQRRLKGFAEQISPEPGRTQAVVRKARAKRRLVAVSAGLAMLVAVGGLAGAATLLGGRDGIKPTPGPDPIGCADPTYDVAVFLEDATTQEELAALRDELESDDGVASIRFVTAAEAYEEFKEYYADQPEFWENLPEDALPSSLRVILVDGADAKDALRRFRSLEHVDAAREASEIAKDRPDAACSPESDRFFVRYFFEGVKGDMSASGTAEINAKDGTICLEARLSNNIVSAYLIDRQQSDAERLAFVVDLPSRPDPSEDPAEVPRQPSSYCTSRANRDLLHLIINEPDRFGINFRRGPDDRPGLVVKFVLQGKVLDDDADSADVLQDTIEAQGGTIRLQVIPETNGNTEIELSNETEAAISYGHEYLLQKRRSDGWAPVESPTKCVFTQELIFIAPGDQISHPIGPYDRECSVLPIGSGEYRVSKTVELQSGDRAPLSVSFSVAPQEAEAAIIRPFVRVFMRARVDGAGAEEFLHRGTWTEAGPPGRSLALYPDPPPQDFRIEFVDDLGDGSFEVGVSLVFKEGTAGETLFVRKRQGSLVILGAREGLTGP